MPLLCAEKDAAGDTHAFVVGRMTATLGNLPNADVAAIVAEHRQRFLGAGSADTPDRRRAVAMIEEGRALGLRMVNFEPGAMNPPLRTDDRRLYLVCAPCEDIGMPIALMVGGEARPHITYTAPECLDRTLAAFPRLTVVCSHGGWRWVQEVLHVAFRRPNLLSLPQNVAARTAGDGHLHPRGEQLPARADAVRHRLSVLPAAGVLAWLRSLPLKPDAMAAMLWRNASRLLGLPG